VRGVGSSSINSRLFDPKQSLGVIGKGQFAVGSYYLGDNSPETVSFLVAGVTDRLELSVNQYYQEKDWTLTARYGILKEGEGWWRPSLVLGVHDLGTPEDTSISLTGMKHLEVPFLEEVMAHAGIFRETEGGGDTRGFGGVSKQFWKRFDLSVLYDGYDPHVLAGANYKGFRVFVMAYRMEYFGGGLSLQFGF
jgi:hypothetical protein